MGIGFKRFGRPVVPWRVSVGSGGGTSVCRGLGASGALGYRGVAALVAVGRTSPGGATLGAGEPFEHVKRDVGLVSSAGPACHGAARRGAGHTWPERGTQEADAG